MIPKIIHYIWLGGKKEPKILKRCKKSWKKYCPDYEIKRWDESNLDINSFLYTKQAYDAKKYAFASDVFRFDILDREGGIYLDIDVELIRPIDEFLKFDIFCGFENENYVAPGLILGSKKNNAVLKELFDDYKNRQFAVTKGMKNQETICAIFTNKLKEMGFCLNNTNQVKNNIAIFSSEYFCPKSMTDGRILKTENTYSIHHYASTWVPWHVTFVTKCKQFAKRLLGRKLVNKLKQQKNDRKNK